MSKCLVTTLNEAVDSELLKLGEMQFHVSAASLTRIRFGIVLNKSLTLTIRGNGYFTDSTGTQNYGNSVTQSRGASVSNDWYVPEGEYDIVADNKYNIFRVDLVGLPTGSNIIIPMAELGYSPLVFVFYKNAFNLEDLKRCSSMLGMYISGKCKGTLADILAFSDIKTLSVDTSTLSGDLASISELDFKEFSIYDSNVLYGNISAVSGMNSVEIFVVNRCPNVTGKLHAFANKTSLKTIGVAGTQVAGNISSLAGLTLLTSLNVSNTAVTGDTSSLSGLTNLTTFTYTNTAITGTWPLV